MTWEITFNEKKAMYWKWEEGSETLMDTEVKIKYHLRGKRRERFGICCTRQLIIRVTNIKIKYLVTHS